VDVRDIERKIDQTETPPVEKVAVAYSGGLDSALCIALLQRKYKAKEIVAVTVDVGQGEEEMKMAREKAKVLGIEPVFVDKREEFSEVWVAKAIRANSDYLGYPVSTSMTRQLIAREVAKVALETGCDAIMEGSSGKGNDQYRMHNVFKLFAPGLKILVPVRDFDLTRKEEEELSRAWGIPITETIPGGDDKTLWCRSIASGAIDLDMEVPREVWIWYVPPEEAPDSPELIELEFEDGIPVGMDGRRMKLGDIISALNELAGRHGIGKIDIIEDGIMDLKSREVYEAPAATVILKAHRDLEQLCLTKEEIQFKKLVDQKWAYMVYHGEWFHPLKEDLDAFIEKSQEVVSGRMRIKLYKGNVDIVSRESETKLFFPEIRSIKSASFDQRMCRDAAQIRGLPFEILAKRMRRR
jgi:argininosuccinate synthase